MCQKNSRAIQKIDPSEFKRTPNRNIWIQGSGPLMSKKLNVVERMRMLE